MGRGAAAAPVDAPPLHAAVWEGNLDRVRAILQEARDTGDDNGNGSSSNNSEGGTEAAPPTPTPTPTPTKLQQVLEAKDAHGNSALHLAVRLVQPAQRAIVQLLLENGASVTSRSADGWNCVHDATLCDDEFLLARLFLRSEKQLYGLMQARQESFFRALEHLPDFEAEIFIEAHSWVPMVSKILPSDTVRIWKRGSQLRCDSELKGLDGVKWKRGKMSHMFMGRHSERPGHAVVVDHEGETFYDVTKALHHSTVTSMDLGLQMLLTTPLSSSTLDSSKMTFRKRKDVTSVKPNKKHGHCPWTGTKYKMENFAVSAQFRPVVKPDRQLKETTTDAPLEEIEHFVKHLSLHSLNAYKGKTTGITASANNNDNNNNDDNSKPLNKKATKQKSMRNTNFDSDDDLEELALERDRRSSLADIKDPRQRRSISSSADKDANTKSKSKTNGEGSQTLLRLPKGKKVEMHLDVCAGDTIRWNFTSKSKEFCFTATYFHDDQKLPVCQTDGVKNIAIAGAFEAEFNGSFVLMWLNTQKNFSLDMNGIKILYDVGHTRPTFKLPAAPSDGVSLMNGITERRLSATAEGEDEDNQEGSEDNDERSTTAAFDENAEAQLSSEAERCQAFLRLDHIPNPLTATTSFQDYFGYSAEDNQHEKKSTTAKMSSLFKRSNQQKKRSPSSAAATNDEENDFVAEGGARNTFRSLTVLPETRRVGKEFEAKVFMADSFPFQLADFLPIIQFLSHTGEHVKNLEEFFELKLPPGFPVKFELPMMFTVRIAYTFQKITLSEDIDPRLFEIPRGFKQVFSLKEVRS